MRRTVLLALCAALVGGLAIAAAGIAGSPSTERPKRAAQPASAPDSGPFAVAESRADRARDGRHGRRWHRGRRHNGFHRGLHRVILASLAGRLDVTPARLRRALRAVHRDVRGDLVDPRTATPEQRVAMKERLAGALASELGLTSERVLGEVRAELAARLDMAVAFGAVTERGRALALGCFDDPAACDLAALKAEVRFGRHGRGGR